MASTHLDFASSPATLPASSPPTTPIHHKRKIFLDDPNVTEIVEQMQNLAQDSTPSQPPSTPNLDTDMLNLESSKETTPMRKRAKIGEHKSKDDKLSSPEKTQSTALVEHKNGKFIFRDKLVPLANRTVVMAGLLKFHEYRANQLDKENQEGQTEAIPKEYLPLVGMLVQDSDETLGALVKRVTEKLCPVDFDDSDDGSTETTLLPKVVEAAIRNVATRQAYGVSENAVQGVSGVNCFTVPSHLLIYRWEVNDLDAILPKELKEAVEKRRAKREELSIQATKLFRDLPVEQQVRLLTSKKRQKVMKEAPGEDAATAAPNILAFLTKEKVAAEAVVEETIEERERKASEKQAERERKAAEKQAEKQAEKDRKAAEKQAEKEKKEAEKKAKDAERRIRMEAKEAQKKKKENAQPKLNLWLKKVEEPKSKKVEEHIYEPKREMAMFVNPVLVCAESQYFKPFNIKPGMTVVEYNRFLRPIVSNFDELVFSEANRVNDDVVPVVQEESRPLLREFLGNIHPMHFKRRGVSRRVNLRKILGLDTGAGRAPDAMDVDEEPPQRVQCKIKMKLLKFEENTRPAYYGTWTKQSKSVNGRRPLAKDDELLDYSHDSEAEWEEEEEGEDLESDDEEEKEDKENSDDENDWLVPDGYLSDGEGVDGEARKDDHADKQQDGKAKQKQRVPFNPIKQVIIGPNFEDTATKPTELDNYGYEFLFGLVAPIDPFKPMGIAGNEIKVATAKADARKMTPGRGKTLFPDEHLGELVDIVHGKSVGLVKLVEEAKAKWAILSKASIEAKIRELAFKENNRWNVKIEILKSLGRDIGQPRKAGKIDGFVKVKHANEGNP